MIARLVAAAILAAAAGCGSSEGPSPQTARIDRCTERFLADAETDSVDLRRYVRTTYCERFEQRGWIYEDGTLSIDAYTKSGTEQCAEAESGGSARTVPCEELEGAKTLDCALLNLVRRREVREYVEEVQQRGEIRCDNGTSLDELGAG